MNSPLSARSRSITFWLVKTGQLVLAVVSLLLFLVSLELITYASHALGGNFTSWFFSLTGNPFVSLCIGLLFTAIIQSSSTCTSTLVAMVASGLISLEAAVPMVIGANIGTSVTPVLVSLANLGSPKAFRSGFMVAGSHVIFNVLSAIPFFFLESEDHVLSSFSRYLAKQISYPGGIAGGWSAFYATLISPLALLLQSVVVNQPLIILFCALVLLFMCIFMLTATFKMLVLGTSNQSTLISNALGRPGLSLFSGIGITALIHSSSASVSLSVMLAAAGKASPKKLFPYVMGANIGTTITALMAAIGRSESALAIALTHFLFNASGVLLFFPIPALRNVPVSISRWAANQSVRHTFFAFAYLILIFYALPVLVIFISEKWGR